MTALAEAPLIGTIVNGVGKPHYAVIIRRGGQGATSRQTAGPVMTSEELRQKYRLLKLVAEQGVRTYHALNARGHIVMVHHLAADSPETQRLLTLLDALGPVDKMRIVERLTVDGAPVVVTQFIQGFQTLPAWLQATAQRARSAPGPAAAASPPGAGELTQLFGPTSVEKPPPEIVPPRSAEAPGPQPASSERPPGDFTSVFGPTDGAPPPTPAPPVPRPPEPPSGKGPNVRWREPSPEGKQGDRPTDRPMVRWKKEDAVPPASPRSKPPGELTRLFGAAGSAPADSTAPPASPPPSESASSPGGSPPGEFTRLFQPDRNLDVPPAAQPEPSQDYWQALNTPATPSMTPSAFSSPPDSPPSSGKEPGEFTRLMSGVPTPPSVGRAANAPASPRTPGGAGGPGEFTRIVAAAAAPAPPPPAQQEDRDAPPAERDERAGRSRRLLVLLVALGVLVILAAALVLFLAP